MAIENISFSGLDGSLNPIVDTLLQVPTSSNYAITTVIVCNTYTPDPSDPDLGESSFDLHLVPASEIISAGTVAGAVADNNRIIKELTLKAGESYSFDSEKVILEEGDAVAVAGDSAFLSATISYLEI